MVIAAVLVSESNLAPVNEEVDRLKKRYFQTGEIKSKNLKGKQSRKRIELLKAIMQLRLVLAGL